MVNTTSINDVYVVLHDLYSEDKFIGVEQINNAYMYSLCKLSNVHKYLRINSSEYYEFYCPVNEKNITITSNGLDCEQKHLVKLINKRFTISHMLNENVNLALTWIKYDISFVRYLSNVSITNLVNNFNNEFEKIIDHLCLFDKKYINDLSYKLNGTNRLKFASFKNNYIKCPELLKQFPISNITTNIVTDLSNHNIDCTLYFPVNYDIINIYSLVLKENQIKNTNIRRSLISLVIKYTSAFHNIDDVLLFFDLYKLKCSYDELKLFKKEYFGKINTVLDQKINLYVSKLKQDILLNYLLSLEHNENKFINDTKNNSLNICKKIYKNIKYIDHNQFMDQINVHVFNKFDEIIENMSLDKYNVVYDYIENNDYESKIIDVINKSSNYKYECQSFISFCKIYYSPKFTKHQT